MKKFIKTESGEIINSRYIKFFKVLDRIDYQDFKDGNCKRFGVVAYIDGEGNRFVYSSDSEEDCVNYLNTVCEQFSVSKSTASTAVSRFEGTSRFFDNRFGLNFAELVECFNVYNTGNAARFLVDHYDVDNLTNEEILRIAECIVNDEVDTGLCSGEDEARFCERHCREHGIKPREGC